MVKEINQINSSALNAYLLMMIKLFILLIVRIIVSLNGNVMKNMAKLLQVEMEKEIK
jgi:hypothetical protein